MAIKFCRGGTIRAPKCDPAMLPEVPLDIVFSFLDGEDLRRCHQVSQTWKHAVESRKRENLRRQALVTRIRENKENIGLRTSQELMQVQPVIARRAIRERSSPDVQDRKKHENQFILAECTNQIEGSCTPTSESVTNYTIIINSYNYNSSNVNNINRSSNKQGSCSIIINHKQKQLKKASLRRLARL